MNNRSMHVTAIIMCGGRGTRMGKSTEEKPLQKLKGRMLIEYVVDALVGSNIFERIVGVTTPTPLIPIHSLGTIYITKQV